MRQKIRASWIFLFAKERPSNDDVGVGGNEGAPYSRRYDREFDSKPAVSLKKRVLGGLP